MGDDLTRKSHQLSKLLRHAARDAGLAMDVAGFARVDDVLARLRMSRDELARVVAENNKSRYELTDDGRVRACQGHSLAGTPVTQEGLEATWAIVTDDAPVFHGTSVDAARAIAAEGVRRGERTHVHLAPAVDATVGKRARVDVLLEVSPKALRDAGLALFRAPNGVLLAREVPRSAIVGLSACTAAGREAEAELRALYALSGPA